MSRLVLSLSWFFVLYLLSALAEALVDRIGRLRAISICFDAFLVILIISGLIASRRNGLFKLYKRLMLLFCLAHIAFIVTDEVLTARHMYPHSISHEGLIPSVYLHFGGKTYYNKAMYLSLIFSILSFFTARFTEKQPKANVPVSYMI